MKKQELNYSNQMETVRFDDPPYFVYIERPFHNEWGLVPHKLYTVTRVRNNYLGTKKMTEFYIHEINKNLHDGAAIWLDKRHFQIHLLIRPQ